MGEILGVGLSHYPPLCGLDEDMSGLLGLAMRDDSIPARFRDPENWPEEMKAEWAEDEGLVAAAAHRMKLVAGFRRIRSTIDKFCPDVLLLIGDDQYENFQETVIPPFAVLAYDRDLDLQVTRHTGCAQIPILTGPSTKTWLTITSVPYRPERSRRSRPRDSKKS